LIEVAHLSAVAPGGQLANEHEEDPFFFLSLRLPVAEPVDRGAELERAARGVGGDVAGDAAAGGCAALTGGDHLEDGAANAPRVCIPIAKP